MYRKSCIDRMTSDEKGYINPVVLTFEGVQKRPLD